MCPIQSSNQTTDDETKKKKKKREAIQAYQSALDDVVSTNGLFMVALFLDVTFQTNLSIVKDPRCTLSDVETVACRLLVNQVISFSCFLLSSLMAKALKSYLSTLILKIKDVDLNGRQEKFIRCGLTCLSTWGSIFGCIFLTMLMMDVIRIRLGKITCGHDALSASASLIALVSLALLIYVPFTLQSVYANMIRFEG